MTVVEETHSKPKSDRLELLRRCRANFSPIFGLFPDPERKVEPFFAEIKKSQPLFNILDANEENHVLWAVDDQAQIKTLTQIIKLQPAFIADGHHRYETALSYAHESGSLLPGGGYVLSFLVSLLDPGLIILPTHRLLTPLTSEQQNTLWNILDQSFTIMERGPAADLKAAEFTRKLSESGKRGPCLGLILPDQALLLTPKRKSSPDTLDTVILKDRILDPLFGGAEELLEQAVSYERDASEAWRAVLECRRGAAFIMNPTPMEAVTARALRGEKMPQKSTYFHPKLLSGLLIYHLELSHT